MTLIEVCTYRYFASGSWPGRSLWWRLTGGLAVMAAFGWFVYRATPSALGDLLPQSQVTQAALGFLLAGACTAALFVLTHVAYRNYLGRAEIIHFLAITPWHAKVLRAYMYAPLFVAGAVLSVALAAGLLSLPVGATLLACALGVAFAAGSQAILRGAGYMGFAQLLAFVQAGLGLFAVGQVFAGKQPALEVWGGMLLATCVLGVVLARSLPIRWQDVSQRKGRVIPFSRLKLVSMVPAVALRNTRFMHAVLSWAFLSGVLLALAKLSPGTLPFDAAAMGSLLLAGVIGQEARSLWSRQYPIPLILYGDVLRWHVGNWLVACVACATATGVVLLAGVLFYPGELSAGMWYVVCLALNLTAVSLLAGSVVVPERTDIVSQIASAVLYMIAAWGVIRLLASFEWAGGVGVIVLATSVTGLAFGLGWIIELMRWNKATKGNYANVFRKQ